MTSKAKNGFLAIGSAFIIPASAFLIFYQQVETPKHNVALHQRVGEVMAEQTARILERTGRILLITIPVGGQPELQTQLKAFRSTLKQLGDFHLKEHELDTKDQPKYGIGTGLSSRRFVRTVKNNPDTDVLVSFVGAPHLSDEEVAELKHLPKFL